MAPARTSPASTSSSASRSRSDAGAAAATTLFPGAVVASLTLHAGLIGVAIAIGALSAREGGERRTLVAAIEPPAPDAPALEAELLEPDEPVLDELVVDPPDVPDEPLPTFTDDDAAEPLDDERTEAPTEDAVDPRPDELTWPPVERFARLPSQPLGGRPTAEPEPAPAPAPEPPPPPAPEPVPAEPTGVDDAPPLLLASPAPNYPSIARRRGWEGSVVLVMRLDSEGRVVDAQVETSSGHAVLDEAARAQVLRAWRYVAGPAGRTARHRITFSLTGGT
jgi:protein TonB